jgi:hypothetical protein
VAEELRLRHVEGEMHCFVGSNFSVSYKAFCH